MAHRPIHSLVLCAFLIYPWNWPTSAAISAAETTPLHRDQQVVLILDRSGSMAQDKRLSRMLDSAAALIASLPSGHRVGIVVFNDRAEVLVPLTTLTNKSRSEVIKKLDIDAAGGTDIISGVQTGLRVLDGKDGTLIVLSDGLQTGSGTAPVPRTIWGPLAQDSARQARSQNVIIYTVGLGESVQADPLLSQLADETGGRFYGIRQPSDLLTHFVDFASQLGQFWRRSQPGDFFVDHAIDVVQLVTRDAGHQLFRVEGVRRVPVEPVIRYDHGDLRAERFHLGPAEYSFRPDASGRSDLLRPLDYNWSVTTVSLPANRKALLSVQATPRDRDGLNFEDMTAVVHIQWGGAAEYVTVNSDPMGSGAFVARVDTPPRATRFKAVIDARQRGWFCRSGHMSGEVVLPHAINVQFRAPSSGDWTGKLETLDPEKSVNIPFDVSCETSGRHVELVAVSSNPQIRISPETIQLAENPQSVTLKLERAGSFLSDESVKSAAAKLTFTVRADDVVAPTINGNSSLVQQVTWLHLRPSLRISELPEDRIESVARGNLVQFPVEVSAVDLRTVDLRKEPDLQVTMFRAPVGFAVGWLKDGQLVKDLRIPTQGTAMEMLAVAVDKSVEPGQTTIRVLFSHDSNAKLNGQSGPFAADLVIGVSPVAVTTRIIRGSERWSVPAPVVPARRRVQIEVVAADGGSLPTTHLNPESSGPILIESLGDPERSATRLCADYELSIAPQSAPGDGIVRFTAAGSGVVQDSCALAFVIPPRVIRCPPQAVVVSTRWPEWLHRRVPPSGTPRFQPDFRGEWANDVRWTIQHRNVTDNWADLLPDKEGRYRFIAGREYQLCLGSEYEHARFTPSKNVPVIVTTSVLPCPLWLKSLVVLVVAITLFARFRPVKVLCDGQRRWGFGRIRLGRMFGDPSLGVTLDRRNLKFRGKNHGVGEVTLRSDISGNVKLQAGDSIRVHRDDTIHVQCSDGSTHEIVVLSAASVPTPVEPLHNGNLTQDLYGRLAG